MREWRVMLGPFLIWAAHFVVVYALASVADLSDATMAQGLRMTGLGGTALCGLGLMLGYVRSRRQDRLTPLSRQLAGVGCAASLIAIAWQSLPLVISS